jgi:uncharacterized membrane protein required for colicin V production
MEPIVTIIIGLFLIVYMRVSTEMGLFREMANLVSLLVGLWVALRYWFPATAYLNGQLGGSTFHLPAGNAALVAFWAVMLAVALPLLLLFSRMDDKYLPRYPRILDAVGGLVFGVGTSLVVVCSIMITVSVFVPKVWPEYNRDTLLVPWDRLPITAYRKVETEWLGVSGEDPARSRFPTFSKHHVDDLGEYWQ